MGDETLYDLFPTFETWRSTWEAQIGDEALYKLSLFIQIVNYLLNLVFPQMGDEAFYQLFLFIQIGNYLWNLVFHLGSPDG
jgi:hypothetical protein